MCSATSPHATIAMADLSADGELSAVATGAIAASSPANGLQLLHDIVRVLPTAVTVQDESGEFLIVNDAAAARIGIASADLEITAEGAIPYRHREAARLGRVHLP